MSALDELLSVLKMWPTWKQIESTVGRVDALEKRIVDLESKLARCPGEGCPKCGELSFRTVRSFPDDEFGNMGVIVRVMKCEKCGYEEEKTINPQRAR